MGTVTVVAEAPLPAIRADFNYVRESAGRCGIMLLNRRPVSRERINFA